LQYGVFKLVENALALKNRDFSLLPSAAQAPQLNPIEGTPPRFVFRVLAPALSRPP
jgi:hypothetical protein